MGGRGASSGRKGATSAGNINRIIQMASGGEGSDSSYDARILVDKTISQSGLSPLNDLYSEIHSALSGVIYHGGRRQWGGRNLTNYNQAVSDLEKSLRRLY